MNPSHTLIPSSHYNPSVLPFTFAPHRISKRRRFRLSFPRSFSAASSPPQSPKDLDGLEILVDKLSPPLRLATSAVVVAGAVAAGYRLGSKFSGSPNVAVGGSVVLGVAGAAVSYALNALAPQVAAVNLHNYVVGLDHPSLLKKEDIDGIANRYGVRKQDGAFKAEICDIYSQFVASVLPSGDMELNGDEAEKIISFKNSLGIDDPDAASMHMEVGRKIFRQRLEVGDREGDIEQRRDLNECLELECLTIVSESPVQAFQKLIYVSNLVFGEASSFLLPWKRVFNVTDSQVEVAIRDNAQRLYASKLKSVGRDINAEQLVTLREAQNLYCLSDQLAENLFKEHTRKLVEGGILVGHGLLKSRTRSVSGVSQVVEELDKILNFNNLLISLKNHPDVDRFAQGVGPVSLLGGEYDGNRRIEDLKLLYRTYIANALSGGRMENNKLAALNQLKNIFGLGKREAEAIMLDVTSKVYRKKLAQAVSSGALEMADSKAAFLHKLCDELHFDPRKASEIHEEIYHQKLQQLVADGELSDKDVAALLRLRIMLCIPQQTIEAAHSDICGSLFEKVVKEAIASGVDGYDAETKKSVRNAAHGLRLTRDTAMTITSKAVRKIFVNYIKRALAAGDRTQSAKELKKMIAFNTLVVTELVKDIKEESDDESTEKLGKEDMIQTEDKEWDSIQTLKKIRPNRGLEAKLGKLGQTEITLKDDIPERDRTDLYKTYLLFCLTGKVTRVPFGAQITTKMDDSEYVLLNQLGGILGLSGKEIVEVHRSLAEQAFKQQAEIILADGQLTKVKVEQLNNLQKEVGLPQEYSQKIIKSITTTKLAAAIETAVTQGRLSFKQIKELKEANVDIDNMVAENMRETLFKKTVDDILSSGTGEFHEEEVYELIPLALDVNKEKARGVVQELAQTRLSSSLIQAVALLRQRNRDGVVSELNNMLACDKAVPPSQPLVWEVQEELVDLYTIYMKSNSTPETLSRLQYLLGINDSTAAALQETADTLLHNTAEVEEFVF